MAGRFAPNSYGALLQDDLGAAPGWTNAVVEMHPSTDGVPIAGTAADLGVADAQALCVHDGGDGRDLRLLNPGPAMTNKAAKLAVGGAVDVAALGTGSLIVLSSPASSYPLKPSCSRS